MTFFKSFRIADGVLTDIGEPAKAGLARAEPGRAEEAGVLKGPSFGVFRADNRGVLLLSSPSAVMIPVLICVREGFRECRFCVAASGRDNSSSPPSLRKSAKMSVKGFAAPLLLWPADGCRVASITIWASRPRLRSAVGQRERVIGLDLIQVVEVGP